MGECGLYVLVWVGRPLVSRPAADLGSIMHGAALVGAMGARSSGMLEWKALVDVHGKDLASLMLADAQRYGRARSVPHGGCCGVMHE